MDDAEQRHLGGLERHRRAVDLGEALQQQLPEAVDGGVGQAARPFGIGLALLGRLGRILRAADLGAGDAVDALEEAAQHRRGLDAEIVLVAQRRQRRLRVAREEQAEQAADRAAVGEAEHRAHLVGGDAAGAVGDRLVEDREAVAGRAFGGAGDERERLRLDLDAFRLRDFGEMGGEGFGRDAAEVEALAAREDGDRDLVHLGRGEQELDVRRRFLERLQKRVERVLREHVDFVDDVDLVARRDRGVAHRLDDLAHVVDAGVAGGVHLDDVDMAAFGDGAARLADAARARWSGRHCRRGRCSSAPWR